MPAAYLPSESEELEGERARLIQGDYNAWFDGSPIKARFKKACMQDQRFRCCYCQRFNETMNNNDWELEHVLSERDYPQFFTEPLNLTVACHRCNNAKSQKDILDGHVPRPPLIVSNAAGDYTIPHPHLTVWSDHLRHTDHIIYEEVSPKGKALIICCELNGKAEEAAGLDAGAIRTARAHRYFEQFGAHIPQLENVDFANAMMDAAVAMQEESRTERMMERVREELARQERAAERRRAVALAAQS